MGSGADRQEGCKLNPLSTAHVYGNNRCIHCGEVGLKRPETKQAPKCHGKPPIDVALFVKAVKAHGEMLNSYVRVLGMVAENKQREALGQSMAFSYEDFAERADLIKNNVSELNL